MLESAICIFRSLAQELQEAANAKLAIYHRIRQEVLGEAPNQYLAFEKLEGDELMFEGDEYWRFQGHEHHTLSLPVDCLYNSMWESAIRGAAETELNNKRERAERDRQAIEANEKSRLLELRRKYPNA